MKSLLTVLVLAVTTIVPATAEAAQPCIALSYDDGPSAFRPELLEVLRQKRVVASFFDNGVRVEANPAVTRFQQRAGHVQLSHSYLHVHMDQLPAAVIKEEVRHNERVLARAGAPLSFKGIRPPFGGSNENVQRTLKELGYTSFLNRVNTDDWVPEKTARAIHDDLVPLLRPGVIIGMHDGPIDTTAGKATVDATAILIDTARAQGHCFGVLSPDGTVVPGKYVGDQPVPRTTAPVPYHLPLAFGTVDDLREPWVRIPSEVKVSASHSPRTFERGGTGTLTLRVTGKRDGAPVSVTTVLPKGLTATSVSGRGWTCSGLTCTRGELAGDVITVAVSVAADASPAVTSEAAVTGHGGTWTHEARDTIRVR